MVFNLDEHTNPYAAMHCKTEEEAEIFLNYLHAQGRTWSGGDLYISNTHYDTYGDATCYAFNDSSYSRLDYFLRENHPVFEFSDYEWNGYNLNDEDDFVSLEDVTALEDFLNAFYTKG